MHPGQDALHDLMASYRRFVLATILGHIENLEGWIEAVGKDASGRLDPYRDVVERLETIPAVAGRIARVIAAEVGVDVAVFPTALFATR